MNPSSDVCKKCLVVGIPHTKWYFGVDTCYLVFQVNNISWDHSILFHFGHIYMGTIQAILEWGWCIYAYAMWLKPLLHFTIPTMNVSMFSQLSWWHKCQPCVPSFRELPKRLDKCHWSEQCLSDYRCCPHLCPDYIMGAPMLCSLSRRQSLTLKVSLNLSNDFPC